MLSETSDKEEVEMLKEESSAFKTELPDMEEELKSYLYLKILMMIKMLLSKFVQLRGDEAAIFAGDLMRMYSKIRRGKRI